MQSGSGESKVIRRQKWGWDGGQPGHTVKYGHDNVLCNKPAHNRGTALPLELPNPSVSLLKTTTKKNENVSYITAKWQNVGRGCRVRASVQVTCGQVGSLF